MFSHALPQGGGCGSGWFAIPANAKATRLKKKKKWGHEYKDKKKKVIPVSVKEVKVRFWSQTSGAGTPDSVQRWLQVARPPKQGSRQAKNKKRGIER